MPAHAPDPAPPSVVEVAPGATFEPGQVIVRFREGVDQAGRIRTLDGARVNFRKALPLRGAQLVTVPAGGTVAATVAALRRDPRVAYAQPNYLRRLASVPSDRWFSQQWAMRNTGQNAGNVTGTSGADIRATSAWDLTTGSSSVAVAVVDTGINASSPDFAGRLVGGQDFVPVVPDSDPTDPTFHSHGTWVAGLIAARGNDGTGVAGVDWNAKIMPLRVFDSRGLTNTSRIVSAYNWAASHGARIVNASFSGATFSQAESDAIAAHPDVLFVAAAGNANADLDTKVPGETTTPAYPCAYKLGNIICVAATDQNDRRAPFSNYGQKTVDVAAPGENMLTTSPKPGNSILPACSGVCVDAFPAPLDATRWKTSNQGGSGWDVDTALGTETTSPTSLADSPGSGYNTAANSGVVTTTTVENKNALDLSQQNGCHLDYKIRYDINSGIGISDSFSVESIDGAANPVSELSLSGRSPNFPLFTQMTTELKGIDLSPSAHFRLRFTSGGTTPPFDVQPQGGPAPPSFDGVNIDDLTLRCEAPASAYNGAADEYLFVDGTSFSAPIVSGVASLLLSIDPSLSPVALKERIIATSDPVSALANLTVSDGRVNADAAVRMAPSVAPGPASVLGDNSARISASVQSRGQASAVFVDYGTDTSYSQAVSVGTLSAATTSPQVTDTVLTGLKPGTVYHYRWRAVNPTGVPSGVEVGPDQTFTTSGPVTRTTTAVDPPKPPPPAPKPACSGLKGTKLAACKRQLALKKAIASCNAGLKGAKNAKKRAVCIRKAAAVSACQVKKGSAKAQCLAKARLIR